MAGSHLDSVSAGPGINDNGSGSAGVLETALAYAASGQTPRNRLRFGFWGAEELGLLGSKYYVTTCPRPSADKIELYLNFDMIASPNPGYFVYDDNPAGNGARDDLVAYFTSKSVQTEFIDVQGRSDHAAFRSLGIPTAGTFSGAEEHQDVRPGDQVGRHGGAGVRPVLPPLLRHHQQPGPDLAGPPDRRHRPHDLELRPEGLQRRPPTADR